MLVLCREVDKATGRVAVYPINAEVTEQLLFSLGIRQRCNPELRYFVTTKAHYKGFEDVIVRALKRHTLTDEAIKRAGGLVPVP